ncbi:hypothetical protein ACOTFH_29315, partial [Achromobacter xylosoxidans]
PAPATRGAAPPPVNPVLQPGGAGHFIMQKTQAPPRPPDDADAVQQLNALLQSDTRAKFRGLLPLIDHLVGQGVPYGAIAAALEKAGITMKAASIRQARCRWRKKKSKTATHATAPGHGDFPTPQATAPAPQPPRATGTIASKADLVQLRRSADTLDLNQLAELGRQR